MDRMALSDTISHKRTFEEDAYEYYPPACCEMLHVTNAVYLATTLQIIFVVTITLLYYFLERSSFINAVEVFRPAVVFIICVNVIGIVCALIGVILQKDNLISAQIALLAGLVIISDLVAFVLVAAMAFGNRSNKTIVQPKIANKSSFMDFTTGYFVNSNMFEDVLGPFWIYLMAILFHLCAACTMCTIGIYRRYCKFLKDKFSYNRVHNLESIQRDNFTTPSNIRIS